MESINNILKNVNVSIANANKVAVPVPLVGVATKDGVYAIVVTPSSTANVVTKAYVRVKQAGKSCALLSFDIPAYAAGDTTTIDVKGTVQLIQGLFAAGEDAEIVFIPESAPAAEYTLDLSVWRI